MGKIFLICIDHLSFSLTEKLIADGAVEKTRTSTGCPTATSTLRVYQFRHDRTWLSKTFWPSAFNKSQRKVQANFLFPIIYFIRTIYNLIKIT